MTFGSLFSGIGGFDLGFERAGMECVWQVECDKHCNTVLANHWPDVRRYTDVRQFDGTTDAVRPELICGGFPCQDLSVAGKRAGLAGERSGLFFEFMRIVAEYAPRWVCIENVPGLLSSNEGRDMGVVLGALAKLGYGFAYRVLDAQWFGLAQRRRRVFIVGCFGDWRRAARVLFEPESLPWDSPPSRQAGKGVVRCIARGTGSSGYRYDANGEDFVTALDAHMGMGRPDDNSAQDRHLVAMPLKSGANLRHDESHETYVAHALSCEGADASEVKNGPHGKGWSDRDVAFTMESRTKPQSVASMFGVRRLLPKECERLQGFPDDWTAGLSNSARYRALGNAVAVPVAEWICRRIING